MTLLSRACVTPYSIPLKICLYSEIFSVKELRDLETGGRGYSKSLKMAPFDNHIRLSIVRHCKYGSILYCFFELFDVE